jgi:lipopolysaccharide/colanic/teichoic acid biosynthesis glycosyltransferase
MITTKQFNQAASAPHRYGLDLQRVHPSITSPGKRLIDVIGALVGLAITAVLFIPIAIAIQIDNPGPVFYSQIRCGYQGRCFRMWKFRSMVVGAEQLKHQVPNQASGHIFKNTDDPRITNVGRFLRRTSLDELPQFWNVLSGEMSLVGFRPPTVDEVQQYNNSHRRRLAIKPGITGEWQVNGRSCIADFEQVIDLDLRYQQRWSVAYDLQILWRTIWVVLSRRGAC